MAKKDSLDFAELAVGDEVSIDNKGRVLFPRELREVIPQPFVIARSEVGCIALFMPEQWATMVALVKKADPFDPARQAYERLIIGGADTKAVLDGQGRLTIPKDMKSFAKLDGTKVRLVGMTERIEIWSPDEFEKFQKDPDEYNKARRESAARAYRELKGLA
ncbi:MAG: hypothetical protein JSS66_02565 [Armatimonadetes bacterium]|nr:hypothetical protein [Armatimonadota bacterium]